MVSNTNSEPLPPLYEKWIVDLVGGTIPRESRATCDNCAMCASGATQDAAAQSYFFDPTIKCCTYVPTIPNFLVGRILSDAEPAAQPGRASVEKRSPRASAFHRWGWRSLRFIPCCTTT